MRRPSSPAAGCRPRQQLTRYFLAGALVFAVLFATAARTPAAEQPDLEKALAARIDFDAENGSLASELSALENKLKADHPGFRIKILGRDLQLEGITRNQQIRGLKLENRSVADVLTALVLKANPDRSASDPDDPRVKLVWLIGADPDEPGAQAVLITTRAGAKKRGAKLPAVFETE